MVTVKNYDDYKKWRSWGNKLKFLFGGAGALLGYAIGSVVTGIEYGFQRGILPIDYVVGFFIGAIGLVIGVIYANKKAGELDNMEITKDEYMEISENSDLMEKIACIKKRMGTKSDKRISYEELHSSLISLEADIVSSVKSSVSGKD